MSAASKILVINLTRLGDILQSAPLLRSLKEEHPSAEIHYLAVSGFTDVCRMIPGIDRIIPFDFNGAVAASKGAISSLPRRLEELRSFFDELEAGGYDLVINLSHSRVSALICYLIHAPDTRGLTLDAEGFRQIRHPWARYFFTANLNRKYNRFNLVDIHLGLATEDEYGAPWRRNLEAGNDPDLKLSLEAQEKAGILLEDWSGREAPLKIGFQPGASLASKRWPAESFTALGRRLHEELGAGIVVFGSKAERELARQVAEPMGEAALNLAGLTDLETLAAALQDLNLLVTNDTGTQHVAAAVGTPVLSLCFGSALSHETGPYGSGHLVIEAALSCFPCSFQVECTRFRCQEKVHPEAVFQAVQRMLGSEREAQWPDDTLFKGINLWRTGFDNEGFWIQRPALRRPLDTAQYVNLAIREIWKGLLWQRHLDQERAVGAGIEEYLIDYEAPNLSVFIPEIGECLEAAVRLEEIGGSGMILCRELERISRPPGGDLELMRHISEGLAHLDQEISRLGLRLPAVNHLVLDFTFGKQSLEGNQVSHLAAQTYLLYHRLAEGSRRFHAALSEWKPLFRRREWMASEAATAVREELTPA